MFPLTGTPALLLALPFGFAFGWLLHRGRVASYDTILGQFLMRDFTVLKVMLTAIIVGGVGVLVLNRLGLAAFHIRETNLLGVALGAAIFGVGMVIYGYCPGTALAGIAGGSVHALVGAIGMLAGGALYALSYPFMRDHVLSVGQLGKVTLADVTGLPPIALFAILTAVALGLFFVVERRTPPA